MTDITQITSPTKPLQVVNKVNEITSAVNNKQDTLISGINIKTINNQSLLGTGNITIEGGSGGSSINVSTNDTLVETLIRNYYAYVNTGNNIYLKDSTATTNSKIYNYSQNTFVEDTSKIITNISSNTITIKEDKDYQAWTYNGNTYYTLGENPQVGDTLYSKENNTFVEITNLQITAATNNSITIDTIGIKVTVVIPSYYDDLYRAALKIVCYDSNGNYDHDVTLVDVLPYFSSTQLSYSANIQKGTKFGLKWDVSALELVYDEIDNKYNTNSYINNCYIEDFEVGTWERHNFGWRVDSTESNFHYVSDSEPHPSYQWVEEELSETSGYSYYWFGDNASINPETLIAGDNDIYLYPDVVYEYPEDTENEEII